MKLFTKTEKPNSVYYSLSEFSNKKTALFDKDITLEKAQAILDTEQMIGSITKDISYFTEKITKETEELPFGVYIHKEESHRNPERLIATESHRTESYMHVPVLDQIFEDIDIFTKSEAIFKELKHFYRRGYLIHGPPGNGKTAMIRELVTKFINKAHIIWCDTVPSTNFLKSLNKIPTLKILIYEEIVNKSNNAYFDMGAFLEFMDGELSLQNCITIATTNYPERLEANLANRPSRFDVTFKINNPAKDDAYQILTDILRRKESITKTEIDIADLSFAQLKELALLHRLYNISLPEAQKRLVKISENFKAGFEDKKTFGFTSS